MQKIEEDVFLVEIRHEFLCTHRHLYTLIHVDKP